nr:hypothetical protein [Halogranum rubrum]
MLGDVSKLGVATDDTFLVDDLVRFEKRSVLDETRGFFLLEDEIFDRTRGLGCFLGTRIRGHTPPHSIRILKDSPVDFFSTAMRLISVESKSYSVLLADLRRFVREAFFGRHHEK